MAQSSHMHNTFSKAQLRELYDETAPGYAQAEWILNYLIGLHGLRRRLFQQAAGRVLDVAAGTGANLPYLPADCQVTAVDLSPGMLAKAEEKAHKLGVQLEARLMDAEALAFPEGTFQTVISTLSTCTFPDPVRALQEMARVCQSNGRILLLEHGRSSWPLFGRYQDRRAQAHYERAGCRWTQEPQELAAAAGLRITRATRHRAGVFHVIEARP